MVIQQQELFSLRRIVSAYLDLAESFAQRHIPMTMSDWEERLNKFLELSDYEILENSGKISHEIACDKAITEFEKYRVKQDLLFTSDFDLFMLETKEIKDNKE